MKHLLSLLFASITVSLYAQTTPPILWQRPSGGTAEDNIARAWLCNDGSSVMCGQSTSTDGDITGNHGYYDGWVIKLDANGVKQWQKCYGGGLSDGIFAIKQTSDNGFIMAGYTGSVDGDVTGNHGGTDGWVIKTDNNGNVQWKKCIGGSKTDVFNGVNTCNDNGFILVGRTTSTDGDLAANKGLLDGWLVKLDAAGNIEWSKNYGGSDDEYIMSAVQIDDNNFVFCGFSKSNNNDLSGNYGDSDAWFGKANATDGSLLWSYQYGGSGYDAVYNLCKATDSSGRIIAAGITNSPNDYNITGNHGDYDALVLSIDETSGILTEAKCFGGKKSDNFFSIQNTYDKGYILSGSTVSQNGDVSYNADITNGQLWVVKLNNSRTIDWERTYGGPEYESGYGAFEINNGGFFIAGDTYGNGGDVSGYHGVSQRDYWAVKLSLCFIPPVSAATITTSGPACGSNVTLSIPGGAGYYYHWYKNNEEIIGATSPTYMATDKGTYTSVVVSAFCYSTFSPNSIVSKKQKATISPAGTVNKCADDRITFTANTGNALTYKWYRNNKEITGETGSTYKTKKDGKYYVLVTNTNTGCEQKSDKSELVNTCKENVERQNADIKNIAALLEQNKPNPFNNSTIITYTLPSTYTSAKIVITDVIGKPVKEYTLSGNTGKTNLQVDAGTLSSGTYQYTLYVNGKFIDSKKMIIIK